MEEERLGAPSEFAAQLATHLAAFREDGLALPTSAHLAVLIEAMFFASLYEEEARRVDFGIAWQPDADHCATVVVLTTAVVVSPKHLAKLAPATWGEATTIAVRPVQDDLVAWAILERSATARQPLTIRALAAGVLRVDYAGVARALYSRGEIVLLGDTQDVVMPGQWLTRAFAAWTANAVGKYAVDPRAAIVARIAPEVLRHGHGGMILVMPAELPEPVGVRVHYGVGDGADVLVKRYAQVVRDVAAEAKLARVKSSRPRAPDGRVFVRDIDQIAFAETFELVARLTAVDNALLLDTDLRVRGFGVQVIEGEAPVTSFHHINPYTGATHIDELSTFTGTRHPAGVIFCMRQPLGAAAIIVSQDGHLTLALKDREGSVVVIGSYDHAFGWR